MNTLTVRIGVFVAFVAVLVGGYFGFRHSPSSNTPSSGSMQRDLEAKMPRLSASSTSPRTQESITETKGDVAIAPAVKKSESSVPTTSHTDVLDPRAIPLGDGKVASSPRAGYVYSCQTSFSGGGAMNAGDWIQGDAWDLTKKISVQGNVSWPSAIFSALVSGTSRLLSGNGLPVGSHTGIFPVHSSDPAYQYDRNPNSIAERSVSYQLSANPVFAASASCVPMGTIGYALNGVAIYNALDDGGRDAVAHEVQDSCDGHPQMAGEYHYHGPSACMPHVDENNALVGYALDGFGIYSQYDAKGKEYTDADLDECHGITSEIEWDGKKVFMYHYVLTREYPYTVGCFRGTPIHIAPSGGGAQAPSGQGGSTGPTPPQAAIDACSSKNTGAACSFTGKQGETLSGTCNTPPGSSTLACVPR